MRDGTLCLLVEGDPPERILLGLKKDGFGAGKWGGFGGKIEPGEALPMTAVRELEEEAGVKVAAGDLELMGHLSFVFPYRPEWSQVVCVFVAARWRGEPMESDEMEPAWFIIREIPYDRMWQDSVHWLPRVLAGERIQARFTFHADNETVDEVQMENWDGELAGCADDGSLLLPGSGDMEGDQLQPRPLFVAGSQRYIIRRLRLAHCKRGPANCEKCREMDVERICLLDICPPGAGEMQRRVISIIRDGQSAWREFDIVRIFEGPEAASAYAEQNGITDVEM